MDGAPTLLLASASPRRAALLTEAGIPFERGPAPRVDETPPGLADPALVVRVLAERKARAVAVAVAGRWVLAADTLVFLDGRPLGKPADAADARRMLGRLSGRHHEVWTGVALARRDAAAAERFASGAAVARVAFRDLDPAEIEAYAASGEPLDKAGAYAIQGGARAFVAGLEGDADTVVGLPIALVRRLLGEVSAADRQGPQSPPAPGR